MEATYCNTTQKRAEICDILQEFGILNKINAVIVHDAADMIVAIQKLQFIKLGCIAHTLNLGTQSDYSVTSVAN